MQMLDINQILDNESYNEGQIRLYKVDNYWFAFERSAFHLFSANCVDLVFKMTKDDERREDMLVAILSNEEKIRKCMYSVNLKSEKEIVVECRTVFKGFQFWRDNFISLGYKVYNYKFKNRKEDLCLSLKRLLNNSI